MLNSFRVFLESSWSLICGFRIPVSGFRVALENVNKVSTMRIPECNEELNWQTIRVTPLAMPFKARNT